MDFSCRRHLCRNNKSVNNCVWTLLLLLVDFYCRLTMAWLITLQKGLLSNEKRKLRKNLMSICFKLKPSTLWLNWKVKSLQIKHNYLNAAFVHLLLSSGSSVYWRLLRCNCSHSVFPTCKVVLLVSDGKSILQRHVLKPCCRTLQVYSFS